jgi:hypothetical protein
MSTDTARQVTWGVSGSGGIARCRAIPETMMPASHARLATVCEVNASLGLQSRRVLAACDESARTGTVREITPSPPQHPEIQA